VIVIPLSAGLVSFAAFLGYERRVAEPMLELTLFSRRNFAVGNAETFDPDTAAARDSISSRATSSRRTRTAGAPNRRRPNDAPNAAGMHSARGAWIPGPVTGRVSPRCLAAASVSRLARPA
jgi:hypothetical protein